MFDSFNEDEGTPDPTAPEPAIEEITISSYRRSKSKGKRDADLDGLPARVFEHRLSDEELAEKFPNGYKELPVKIYKQLHIIPETFIVDEHHVHIYTSKDNDETIIEVERPVDLFRNSIATPSLVASLVASIINGKYVNTLPIDRLSRSYKCNGMILSILVDAYFEYVKEKYDQVTHNSTIGKVLKYNIDQENIFVYS